MNNPFGKFTIRKKMFLSFAASVVVPVVIICIILGVKTGSQAVDIFESGTQRELKRIDSAMTILLRDAASTVDMVARSPLVQSADESLTTYKHNTVKTPMTPEENGGVEAELFSWFRLIKETHPDLECLGLGTRYGGYVQYPARDRKPGYDPVQRSWYKAAQSDPGAVVRMPAYVSSSGSSIGIVRTVEDEHGEPLGVFSVDITLKTITDILADVHLGKSGYFMLVQDDGTIISDPRHPENNSKHMNDLEDGDYARMHAADFHLGEIDLDGTPMLATVFVSPELGWKFVGLIEKSEVHRDVMSIITRMVFIGIVLTILFMIIGSVMARRMADPIQTTSAMLNDIAHGEGDLTRRLDVARSDEIGEMARWFNEFVDRLEEIIAKVKRTAVQVETSTREVSAGSRGLARTTQEQAAAVEEVAATVEQMSSSVKQNATNAESGLNQTREMVALAGQGGENAGRLVEAMNQISEASRKIGDIILTVDEVAFQTNLLALNAAVEAARAGEHGKGFAVVAEEVRALAQRTQESSRQISALIKDSENKVRAGDEMVQQTGNSIEEIIKHIEQLSQTIEEVAAASGEQSSGVDELNRAITQIDETTQQNAATVEQLASTADGLTREAQGLSADVARFTVSDDGAPEVQRPRTPTAPAAPAAPATPAASGGSSADWDHGFEEF